MSSPAGAGGAGSSHGQGKAESDTSRLCKMGKLRHTRDQSGAESLPRAPAAPRSTPHPAACPTPHTELGFAFNAKYKVTNPPFQKKKKDKLLKFFQK